MPNPTPTHPTSGSPTRRSRSAARPPAESYLVFDKLLDAAAKSGANAIHPGYGFLSENAEFAQAVIDAGLIWIGPSPQSIRDLGDKVTARHIAARAEAPLVPGTPEPVKDADEVLAFAQEYGVPVAIKAAFGGGGRGMKVARTIEEIPELFESATREAVAAFGRGECFVERYLDKPRHVEAQVIADTHGNVVVAGTRDCSLQRRFQKLVEEAPAPFLTDEQREKIHESAKRICKEAGYYGAGTVEYLVGQDGLICFLEVNTRLQVEHPVTEETAGIDLVRSSSGSPTARRSTSPRTRRRAGTPSSSASTARTPAAASCPPPAPSPASSRPRPRRARGLRRRGRLGDRRPVRLDAGQADRHRRHPRRGAGARRAARWPSSTSRASRPSSRSTAPWSSDPAFIGDGDGFNVHTRWIETEWDNTIEPFTGGEPIDEDDSRPRQTVVVEVGGRRLEVSLPGDLALGNGGAAPGAGVIRKKPKPRKRGAAAARPHPVTR